MGMRRLYDWTLHWAQTPQAVLALFLVAFTESSFFPIPPDALLIAMVVARPRRFLRYATVCTIGSALGGVFGYLIGYAFMETLGWRIIDLYNARALWGDVQAKYQAYGALFLAVAAFTPIPYKVATIASGATHLDLLTFVVISSLGRGARFFLVAALLRLFGEPIRAFIEKYFDLLSLLFVLLLVAGFLALGSLR
jgi:membrane protein YqaA with SNARE-associated domain